MTTTTKKYPTTKTVSPASKIEAYFAKTGTQLAPGALEAPEVTSIRVQGESPCQWVDKHGNTPPPGVEFFRVDTTSPGWEMLVRRKCLGIAEGGGGYSKVPSEAGMHWVTGDTEQQVVLIRTMDQREAYQRGKRIKRAARMGKSTTNRPMGGAATLSENSNVHDQRIVLGATAA